MTAAGTFAYTDITDYRDRALFAVLAGETAANRNTLTDGSIADALHVHAPAGLVSTVQDAMPNINLAGTDNEDGTGEMAIQVLDAAGNNLEQVFLIRTWIADDDMSEPDAQTDFAVAGAGEQMREIEAKADYEVITNSSGNCTMAIDADTDKTVYVMAEIDGRIYSEGVAITGN